MRITFQSFFSLIYYTRMYNLFFQSHGFQTEPTFLDGPFDSAWSLGAGVFCIATYKSQRCGEVSTFVKAEIEVLHFKCIRINYEN